MTEHADHRSESLMERPQPLGILPTWWFWNDRDNWRLVGWMFASLAVVTQLLLGLFDLHPLVAGVIAGSVMLLANGLLEKYVRRQALKRRALAAADDGPLP